MTRFVMTLAAAATVLTAGCVAPVGPVEVTRFHAVDQRAELGRGSILVEPADAADANSLEWTGWRTAVEQELQRAGYMVFNGSEAPVSRQVAIVRVERTRLDRAAERGPVSVGVGGSTGNYGSGVGLGVGINLGGASKPDTQTTLSVIIRQRGAAQNLWEGRATMQVKQGSTVGETPLAAPKLAGALLQGFPGQSGETIEVP